MLEQGYITDQTYAEAMADDPYERIQKVNQQTEENSINTYFVDAMVQEIMDDFQEKLGYSETQAYNMLYSGGLQIFATQDTKIQNLCDEVTGDPDLYPEKTEYLLDYRVTGVDKDDKVQNFSSQMMEMYFKEQGRNGYDRLYASEEDARADAEKYKEYLEGQGYSIEAETISITPQPQISLSIMDQHTGYMKAVVGGRGKKEASLTLNRATDTKRQPGSTFKVVSAYAPAFDTGVRTLGSVEVDEPYSYANGRPVSNWYSSGYKGPVTLRYAIEQSMNIIAVKTLTAITPRVGYEYLLDFGFTTLVDNEVLSDGTVMSDVQQALALGGITHGVKNYELNAAYATIADAGVYRQPVFYTKILDHDGNVLIDNTALPGRQVLKESTAWLLTSAMEDVVTKGTGAKVNFGNMAIAGKTGTTTSNVDVWFAGFTPYYTCATWSGYDNNVHMSGVETNTAKLLWKSIMGRIHENLEYKEFVKPDGVVTATICRQSGKLASSMCTAAGTAVTEYFDESKLPKETCDGHAVGRVCSITGLKAYDTCPFGVPGVVNTEEYCPHSYLNGIPLFDVNKYANGIPMAPAAVPPAGAEGAEGAEQPAAAAPIPGDVTQSIFPQTALPLPGQ